MALEDPTYIDDMNILNPTVNDPKAEGDDHLRNIKKAVKNTFPNITEAVTPTAAQLNDITNKMNDYTLDADTGTQATIADGDGVTIAGGNYVDTSISGNTITVDVQDGDTSQRGAIRLIDSYNSSDVSRAPTASALNDAYDALNSSKQPDMSYNSGTLGHFWDKDGSGFFVAWGNITVGTNGNAVDSLDGNLTGATIYSIVASQSGSGNTGNDDNCSTYVSGGDGVGIRNNSSSANFYWICVGVK